MLLRSGDIVFFRNPGLIPKFIRWATRDRGETKTVVNHVGIMVSSTLLVESLSRTVMHPFVPRGECWVYCKKDLIKKEQAIVAFKAISYVGKKYGWLKIAAHAADHLLFGDRYVMRRFCRLDNYPICSWVVAYAYDKIDCWFGVPPSMATPDDIWDWVTASAHWHIVPFTPSA